ncbi:class I SAM-dependent methyltransferase [uncultured Ruegeria sp.]|uniref:class I SAM-dependent methyltransferase n=1 Tax=uncultured Ruegeria sp. TaxID=259304 RepID=UPI00261DEDC2|nr:class I SAM-dependent methyltransferase [uncultured Ruegeria sp.]
MTNTCRHCQSSRTMAFLDLGYAPPSNDYLSAEALSHPEVTYPLRLFVCQKCRLVQTEDFSSGEALFTEEYAYFSSTSTSWLAHAKTYCDSVIERFSLDAASHVVEVASNDGYLLRNFQEAGIPCLGIEPTHSTASAATAIGITVVEEFFGEELAKGLAKSDLVIGNNVFAHVPDINCFSKGLAACLKPQGVVTLEFPHLLNLVTENQFDTVYHEHFSYISLLSAERILAAAGLRVFDVEQLTTHGGSLRLFACLQGANHTQTGAVNAMRDLEASHGMDDDAFYTGFQTKAEKVKDDFLRFVLDAKAEGKSVAGYGAAAKGNTLMNFAGVGPDAIEFVCDAAEFKIGKYLPGSHIPILAPDELQNRSPDYLVIFPWNLKTEIMQSLDWLAGTRFVTAVPELKIL